VNRYLSLVIPDGLDNAQTERCYQLLYTWCTEIAKGYDSIAAKLLLGILYGSGKGVKRNDALAFEHLNTAMNIWDDAKAENDYSDNFIRLFLVNFHAKGNGVQKDLDKAKQLCREYFQRSGA
jgi:TPR repeat protein